MSADIGGRAVLRPAGNVTRSNLRKASKPPFSPIKPPLNLSSKISPPNSLPSTPKPPCRTSPLRPNTPATKLSPDKPSPPNTSPLNHHPHLEVSSITPLDLGSDATQTAPTAVDSPLFQVSNLPRQGPNASDCEREADGSEPSPLKSVEASPHASETAQSGYSASSSDQKPTSREGGLPVNGAKLSKSICALGQNPQNGSKLPALVSNASGAKMPKLINQRIVLTKSTSEVFQRNSANSKVKSKPSTKRSLNRLGSLSFDESSLASIIASKKAAAKRLSEQRKQKVSEYGRKLGKASRVAPDISSLQTLHVVERQRCKFITAQSDPVFVDYHDMEWGVPVHDDRMLFEQLTLAGFQAELSWTAILHKRDAYRASFAGFDPVSVSLFREKHIVHLEADKSLGLSCGKVRGVVNNAQKILEVSLEFGSLDEYLWGFVNRQPMINNYRYLKQVPVKTSKAEVISKDLVKKGFRFVGPTIIYSFMQASGMTIDHLVQCFRYQECTNLSQPVVPVLERELPDETNPCPGLSNPMQCLNFVLGKSAEHGDDSYDECHFEQQEECTKFAGIEEDSQHHSVI